MKKILTSIFLAAFLIVPVISHAQLVNVKRTLNHYWFAGDNQIRFGANPNANISYDGNDLVLDVTAGGGRVSIPDGINLGPGGMALQNSETIVNDVDGTFDLTRDDGGKVTLLCSDDDSDCDFVLRPGGTGDLTIGSSQTSNIEIETDSGNYEMNGGDFILPDSSTGNDTGESNTFIGVPSISMVSLATGTDGSSETVILTDDSPAGECAGVNQTTADDPVSYRTGTNSLKITFASTPSANDGADCTITSDDYTNNESIGFWIKTNTALGSGDLFVELDDDDASTDYTINVPAISTTDKWQWVELDISSCEGGGTDCNAVDGIKFLLSSAGATALAAGGIVHIDTAAKWDSDHEDALGLDVLGEGVISVMAVATASGSANTMGNLTEGTDYFVHYESGNDFLVYMSDQSSNSVVALVAFDE